MRRVRVWDPLIRLFHWSLVIAFAANALFTDPESAIHVWIGYIAVGLIGIRLLWGLVGTRYARFSSFPPSLSGAMHQVSDIATGRRQAHLGHTPLGALMIYNLLLTILAIGASGYMMTTNTFWGVKWVEELHEVLVTWAEVSIVVHIGAVLWESHRTGVNLPRAMISGDKIVPDTLTTQE
ncbi:cytochrome b/b6 domain-containing protein [Rhodobacter sp. NTK016B]|uniref:cytochrome b/b6 domain-containing protein n=1 Tax=Rhodobacter sp. NTK016B TaxID=2759676 RepID=UPI001A8D4C33|nr:cytochrome b/b6 domain-containing protein [Rhodobacter sp. NTK016B]MBN8291386.1 cytochrome b/b6 domain-containing protein [Rhodobacter sp. NTK016B]